MTPDEREAGALGRAARAAESAVAAIARFGERLAGLAVLATLFVVCYAVATRYFLGKPQSWVDEAAGWFVVASVMLAVAEAERRGEHIGVDAAVDKAGPRARRWIAVLATASVAAVAAILIVEGLEMVAFSRMVGMKPLAIPDAPLWMIQALVPTGAALLLLVALARLVVLLAGLAPRGPKHDRLDAHE